MKGMRYKQIEDVLYQNAIKEGIPLAGEFELTSRCNFSCKMCYLPTNDKNILARERTSKEWLLLAKEARNAGMLYLLLTGGEVFMRKNFFDIYKEISDMGFITTIYTNASMITSEIAYKLGRIPPLLIEATLYGASSETYGRVCGNPDGFENAKRGIELMLAEGMQVSLKTTLIRDNVEDYDSIFEFADKNGIGLRHVKYISPSRDRCNNLVADCRLCPEEQVKINLHASKRFDDRLKSIKQNNEPNELMVFDKHKEILRNNSNVFKCASGSCCFWITWEGKMTPCGLMSEPSFSPFEIGFTNAWNKLKESCNSIPECKECVECSIKKYCNRCPARLKNETGFYNKPAPYLCEMAQKLKEHN